MKKRTLPTCREMIAIMRADGLAAEWVQEFMALPAAERNFLAAGLLMQLVISDMSRAHEEKEIYALLSSVESQQATKQ